ncbi:MAG: GNAT family N-acetyltransferase [bacterium]
MYATEFYSDPNGKSSRLKKDLPMEEYPKTVTLKDKNKVTLRLMVKEDMESLLKFYRSIPEENRQFLRIDVTNRQNVEGRFANLDYVHVYPILAMDEGKIVGIATMFKAEMGWKRNLGEVRVLIAPEYRRKGLATIFVRELFYHALKSKIFKIQAEMVEDQESAIAAFERFGFHKEATLRKHITDIHGKRKNLIIMTLDIEDIWYLMEDHVEGYDMHGQ